MANSILCFVIILVILNLLLSPAVVISSKIVTATDSNGNNYSSIGVVSPGQGITLQCPHTGSIKWSLSRFSRSSIATEPILLDNRREIDGNLLKIKNIDFKDSGVYYCEQNAVSYRFVLHILAITKTLNGTVPIMTTSNEINGLFFNQSKLNEKGSANMSCFCDGGTNNTKITINWKGGQYNKWSNLYNIVTETFGNGISSTLYLMKTSSDKSLYGEYTCSCNVVSETMKSKKVYMEVPPMFEEHVTSLRTTESEDVVINCHVWGFPQIDNSSIYWTFQNNVVLREGVKAVVNNSLPGFYQLVIPKVTNSDRGVYTCHASNSAGSNSVSTMLRVKGRYAALWPFIGIIIQLVILVTIIFVYEYKKSQKSKQDTSKRNLDSNNERDAVGGDRVNDSVRQRLVKA